MEQAVASSGAKLQVLLGDRSRCVERSDRDRVLERGEFFGIDPEGTRSRDGRLLRGHTGPARLALRTGAPIIPCAIVGAEDTIDGHACWKIGSTPKETKSSQYTRSTVWIRKGTYAWSRIENYTKSGIARRLPNSSVDRSRLETSRSTRWRRATASRSAMFRPAVTSA